MYVDNSATTLTQMIQAVLWIKSILHWHIILLENMYIGKVVNVHKIKTEDNYADAFTKALTSTAHNDFFYQIQWNWPFVRKIRFKNDAEWEYDSMYHNISE